MMRMASVFISRQAAMLVVNGMDNWRSPRTVMLALLYYAQEPLASKELPDLVAKVMKALGEISANPAGEGLRPCIISDIARAAENGLIDGKRLVERGEVELTAGGRKFVRRHVLWLFKGCEDILRGAIAANSVSRTQDG